MEKSKYSKKYLYDVASYFRKMSNVKILMFKIHNKEYESYINQYQEYYFNYRHIILGDFENALKEYDDEHSESNSDENEEENSEEITKKEKFRYLINIHVFYRLFKMKEYEEITLDNIDQIVEMDAPESEIWYRGQTNKNWQLIPSFFRNARKTFLWEWNDIHSEYSSKPKKVSLIKKLQEFGIHKDLSPYRIASFIQHSIGYSPLIDLTKSPAVALSFALSNTSAMVNFHNDNACVYALNLKGSKILTDLDEIDKALESAKTQTFKPNELIINIVTNKMWQDMLIGEAESTIYLINRPTNDRMLFQKGAFILYDNVIIVDDEVFMSYNKVRFLKNNLKKYIIKANSKESLYEDLMKKYPQYHQKYLLDPYLYLSELDK